jgi:hypothetical protein
MRFVVVFVLLLAAAPLIARANRYASGRHVVHTRRAPVVAHRLVPPFHGVHTYEGRGRR